jgi:ferredoxin
LPIGWTDRQDGGYYRLEKNGGRSLFGYTVGPHSWKKFLRPDDERIWTAQKDGKRFTIEPRDDDNAQRAFIGVRPCELQALKIHDDIFTNGSYADPVYEHRRNNSFIVAVNCTRPGGTCFCASMKTGPKATSGFDLAMTEVIESDRHYFVIEADGQRGIDILKELPTREADRGEIEAAEGAVEEAERKMGRILETDNIEGRLYQKFDDPNWEEIAGRCLSCGNCTMVCPTCFCMNVEDITDFSGGKAERRSRWDSCFTTDFSYIHGGSIRSSAVSRYRQWMMHKLAYWVEQFGTFGCVGCGRCITWCPAGIDITEEAAKFQGKQRT